MDTQNQEPRGPDKNKRKWKHEEDIKLIEVLLDMVNLGAYKAKNGFKSGYLNYVEQKMQICLPNSGLKAKPRIESRIKILKRNFHIVFDMLNGPNTSGLGFDPVKKYITAETAVWDSYIQSHPSHSVWRNKPFPFYDDLIIIFGKDWAARVNAEGPADMMEDIQTEETNDIETIKEDGLKDFDSYHSFSPPQSPRNEGVHNQKKRKRNKSNNNMVAATDIKDAASIIGSEIGNASQIFGKAIGVDAQISEKRQKINYEIRKIPNLTAEEVIKTVCHIAKSHQLIEVFFSMTEEQKE